MARVQDIEKSLKLLIRFLVINNLLEMSQKALEYKYLEDHANDDQYTNLKKTIAKLIMSKEEVLANLIISVDMEDEVNRCIINE